MTKDMDSPTVTIRSQNFEKAKRIAAEISDAMVSIGWGVVSASTASEVGGTKAITLRFRDPISDN